MKMTYYNIKKLSYSNFKYVTADSPAVFDFSTPGRGSLTILDGPNGYGKTTLFDAIELLLTGEIKSFREDLKSRGSDNYSVLANDPKKPMKFAIDFQDSGGKIIHVERQLDYGSNGAADEINILTINGAPSNTIELQNLLHFTRNLFDLGIYISQRESLSFLQNKYKTRGQEVAEILDISFIQKKIDILQETKKCLNYRLDNIKGDFFQREKQLKEDIGLLKQQIQMQGQSGIQPTYERLFNNDEYDFDKREIDVSMSFDSLIESVERLKVFSENYENYQNMRFNLRIDKLVKWNQNDYLALYYRKFIKFLEENAKQLDKLNLIQKAANSLQKGEFSPDCSVYESFGISNTMITKLQNLTLQVQAIEKQLGNRESALQKIIDSRVKFISTYTKQQEKADLEKNVCPLCGTKVDDLLSAINIAERELSQGTSDLQQMLLLLKQEQIEAGNNILKCFENTLQENQALIQLQNILSRVKDLDTMKLEYELKQVGVGSFECGSDACSMDEFTRSLQELLAQLSKMRRRCTTNLSRQDMISFGDLHNRFYQGKIRPHSPDSFQRKIEYIGYQYTQKSRTKIKNSEDLLCEIKKKYDRAERFYSEKIRTLEVILEQHKKAQKTYNNAIQQALKVPIFIFSGKIIQNYPLGLGIYAEISSAKIILKPENKVDDVYNVLSAGQLNGLALSVLLAVHTVYGKSSGLNMLLIDDPLQTIDEVSAISLTDLLTEQLNQGQVMISTHEDQKAKLFQYKFLQSGYDVKTINMQSIYLAQ